jgi:hypothetical protein
MSLSTQVTPLSVSTKEAGSEATPVAPAAGEKWNYVDLMKTAGVAAEVDFGDGNGFQSWLAAETQWSGPFPPSSNPIKVRPAVEGQTVAGIRALARYLPSAW